MVSKPAACASDISATVGAVMFTGATAGAWTAGDVDVTTRDTLIVGGSAVAVSAKCTFSFSGTNGNTPVAGSSVVSLPAKPSTLLVGSAPPLLGGDTASDAFGNTLVVSSARRLQIG